MEIKTRYENPSEADKATSSIFSWTSYLQSFSGIFLNSLLSIIMGSSLEATWLLLNTLQLMSFTPLLSLEMPSVFRLYSKQLIGIHGQISLIPNEFKRLSTNLRIKPYNDYFELMSFETKFFLLNSGSNIEIWIAILLLGLLSFVIY